MLQLAASDAVAGQPILHPENAIRGSGAFLAAGLALVRREAVHAWAFVALSALFSTFVVVAYQAPAAAMPR